MRVGVVGCGSQGELHVEAFRAIDGVEVVAICDRDEARLHAVGSAFDVPRRYRDHRELAAAGLDLVTVCTMPNTHREIVLAALAGGAHVLCEKPFALDLGQAVEMTAAAEAAGRTLGVGFNMRWMAGARVVKGFVEAGELGDPVCARGLMLADDVPWWGRHYVRELSGGGALAATAVHMLDLLVWIAGSPRPATATASMATVFPRKRGGRAPSPEAAAAFDVEDVIAGHIRFEGGFWLSLEGSWMSDRRGLQYSFDLTGTRGEAHLDPLELLGERDDELVDLTAGREADRDFRGSVHRELRDVVEALRAGRDQPLPAREALTVQALTDALYRSARLGHEVEVEAA